MFIIKFNKMIHNKWLWGAFASVVVVAFAGSDLISGRRQGGGGERGGVGTLNGERISFREFDLVRRQIRMETTDKDDPNRDLDMEVWQRIAVLRTARELGLVASDEEVWQILRRDPAFVGKDGAFDSARYEMILANVLGISPQAYEEIRRNQLLVAKVEASVTAGAWGVPSVASEQARGMTDQFAVRVVTVSNTFANAELAVSDEEIESFYKERLVTYHVPERVSVRYVTFAAPKYKDQVKVEEDDLRDFYDSHVDRYQINTNGTSETLPFDDARKIVESEVRLQGARELATDAAAEFADLFYQGGEHRAPGDFERLAAEQSLAVRTTGLFAADSLPFGIDRSSSFAQAAFDLDPESARDQYSDAVSGRDASYVLAFHQRLDAYDPPLAEVRERVKSEALAFARDRAFAEHLDKVRGTVDAELAKDRTLEAIVSELGLSIGTNMTVTAVDAFRLLPGGQNLAMRMTRMGPGDVSPAVFIENGAVFLQVVSRTAGEGLQQQVMTGQMASQLRNTTAEVVRDDWRRYTLGRMKLETTRPPAIDVGETDGEP